MRFLRRVAPGPFASLTWSLIPLACVLTLGVGASCGGGGGSPDGTAGGAGQTATHVGGGGHSSNSSSTDGGSSDAGGGDGGTASKHTPNEPIAIPTLAWARDIAAPSTYADGASVGGLGAGTVTLRFDGNFYLDRLNIGGSITKVFGQGTFTQTVDTTAGFYMYQKAGSDPAWMKRLDATLGANQATYRSLFPRSWVDYSGSAFPCKVKVEQYSPIIPKDYQRTSYPMGVYRWQIDNPTSSPCDVAVMFRWKNGFGGTSATATTSNGNTILTLKRGTANATSEGDGEFSLAARAPTGVTVTYQSAASGTALTDAFQTNGTLANTTGNDVTGAIAFKATVAPGGQTIVPMVLTWDIPIAQAGTNKWYREYTRHFGRTGLNSAAMATEALSNYEDWLFAIEDWQDAILKKTTYPDWIKAALFNELYYYFIAGTYWEAGAASGQNDNPDEDMFSSLESTAYVFYGTSDVRFYSSWALLDLWPDIDKQEIKQFCDSVVTTRADRPKAIGTCAHDFGDDATLFTKWNAYTYRDSTKWKDLNSKLVLMVYRDYVLTGKTDKAFLDYCWPAVVQAMTTVHGQLSAAGLPASTGIDQTYDDLGLSGDTSYCGSLYLAACEAAKALAVEKGDTASATQYQSWLDTGKASFESELWTGSYYKIDTKSTSPTRIMADQLAGEWYAKAVGLDAIVSSDHAKAAFQTIYANNFKKFAGGTRGLGNVMNADGTVDMTSTQASECWVGTSWGVVAGMVQEGGMASNAAEIGQSLVNTIWNTDSLWFRTPEAWTQSGTIRAPYYMRAPTIWAAKHAYDIAP